MSRYYQNIDLSSLPKKKRKKPWITFLKVIGWVILALVIIVGAGFWIASSYLSPQRITNLIEEKSSEYLNADIKIGKLNYKLFRTYPWIEFELDSLYVISKSLDGVPSKIKYELPEYSDSLATVIKVAGKVNIHDLLHDKIKLRNIEISKPQINIVMVNDSVNNFNISKSLPKINKIPDFDISEIKIDAPIDIKFFSLQNEIDNKALIENFYLVKDQKKFYNIGFEGYVDGKYKDYQLPSSVPLKFSIGIKPEMGKLALSLNKFTFSLAGVSLETEGDITASNKIIDIDRARININIDDIFSTLKYLPDSLANKIKLPVDLEGFIPINLSASLLSPVRVNINDQLPDSISLKDIPPFSALVKIDNAFLHLIPQHSKKITADDVYLDLSCDFDPNNPQLNKISINELRMDGEGISLFAKARIQNLTEENQNFNGEVSFNSGLMKTLSYLIPNSNFKIDAFLNGDVNFRGCAQNFGKDGFKDISFNGDIASGSLNLKSVNFGNVKIKGLKSTFKTKIPEYPINDYSGMKLFLDFATDSISLSNNATNLHIASLDLNLDAMDTISGNPVPFGKLILKAKSIQASDTDNIFSAQSVNLLTKGSLNSTPQSSYIEIPSTSSGEDALIASRISHTPLVLEYNGGGILQTVMSMMKLESDVQIAEGYFKSNSYLYTINFKGLDLNTNLNRVNFTTSNFGIGNTQFSINAEIDGLLPFMTSYNSTLLKADADINFTNVDINQLSWGYYGALVRQGKQSIDSVFHAPPMLPFTSADSVCVAIPRNLEANIRLHSNSAQYMQYQFSPLSTKIIVKDGSATLNQLTVGTPYCTAVVDWTYSTSLLNNIFMNLDAKVNNFNFTPFYKVFPNLVEKAPELKNLSGIINAGISCHFDMFPDMFMNSESLKAKFDIKGTQMEFARQGKIEKITHLMLIGGEQPIQIQNLNITGSFHSNLLEVEPFKVKFDGYQLAFAGINNTAGDIYYHLALEKSPFHLPFGVSITGKLKHPEIKLGGTHIDDYRSEMVSSDPAAKINANIMAYLRHGWLIFIQQAAKYESENEK